MGLIDKEKVVVEIERRIAFFSDINNKQVVKSNLDCAIAFAGLRDFFDSLEVKDVVAEQEGICNGILNTIIGDTWHVKIPLNKAGLKHGDKVKIFITKGE